MEERQFFHRLCSHALQVDVSIEFAAIIDSNGKLLVGKSRHMPYSYNAHKKRHIFNPFRNYNNIGRTLYRKGSFSSENIKSIVSLQSALMDNPMFFRLINLTDDVFLAYISINEQKDKILYIYFRTDKYLEDILLKLDHSFL